eukprot:CAMPEP_0119304962 /NCGR_PEP_ID=MMETSP1333-20130426/6064_1 /TAXON_ID=418940 /ORGANISM="Scyphosphaera apsteinii, Strain RCC1455" /LENGTH=223 /DNA_ID=CAMNT_0007307943 /DNA_START=409 /DNA_END=1081 /DNA_ORIENTATION=+
MSAAEQAFVAHVRRPRPSARSQRAAQNKDGRSRVAAPRQEWDTDIDRWFQILDVHLKLRVDSPLLSRQYQSLQVCQCGQIGLPRINSHGVEVNKCGAAHRQHGSMQLRYHDDPLFMWARGRCERMSHSSCTVAEAWHRKCQKISAVLGPCKALNLLGGLSRNVHASPEVWRCEPRRFGNSPDDSWAVCCSPPSGIPVLATPHNDTIAQSHQQRTTLEIGNRLG